ncbi:MAG: ATP-binding cassette domain-containing protein [Candidatus Marinimicrobia bacterium]|nr:ATP-binding cassette domain-containing protein [Candidatus Neomarinimicrobiota bacterium]
MLEAHDLRKNYGARRAVAGVSLHCEPGAVVGVLGPNGAGKTTTIRMLAGFLKPTAGTVRVKGIDVVAEPARAQRQIGYLPENTPLYDDLTVTEFITFMGALRLGRTPTLVRRVAEVIEACALERVRHQGVQTLSKGYRQRTCLAQALIHDPGVLLLDEPTEGLDPNQKHVVRGMIREMAANKVVLISTHVLEEVDAMCGRVLIINEGRIVADETPAALRARGSRHNVVVLDVRAPVEAVRTALAALPGVARVEGVAPAEGPSRLTLFPEPGAQPTPAALEAIRKQGWVLESVRQEEGDLNEVFRRLTTSEEAA